MNQSYSYENLYTDYRLMVFNFFLKQGLNEDVCDDLTQDVFLSIYKSSSKYEGRSKLSTYITQIAKFKFFEFKRSKKNQFYSSMGELEDRFSSSSFDGEVEKKQEISILRKILEDKSDDSELIVKYVIDEVSLQDLASFYGVNERTVKTRIHRARKRIKHKFNEMGVM